MRGVISLLAIAFLFVNCNGLKNSEVYFVKKLPTLREKRLIYINKDTLLLQNYLGDSIFFAVLNKDKIKIVKKINSGVFDKYFSLLSAVKNEGNSNIKFFKEVYNTGKKGEAYLCFLSPDTTICKQRLKGRIRQLGDYGKVIYNNYFFIYPYLDVFQEGGFKNYFVYITSIDSYPKLLDSIRLKVPVIYQRKNFYVVYYYPFIYEDKERILISFPLSDTIVEITNLKFNEEGLVNYKVNYHSLKSRYLAVNKIPNFGKDLWGKSVVKGLKYVYSNGMYATITKDENTNLYFRIVEFPTQRESYCGWFGPCERDFSIMIVDENFNILDEIKMENFPDSLCSYIKGFLADSIIVFEKLKCDTDNKNLDLFLYKYKVH